jgi:hypothetical protein
MIFVDLIIPVALITMSLSSCNSIQIFDLSTPYTTIPHSKLKDKLRELVQLWFIKKNGQRRYKYRPVLTVDRIHVNNVERGFVEYLADPAI